MSEVTINSIREELGNPAKEIISDEKIQDIINEEQGFYGSVARVARILYHHFALKASRKMGSLSIENQQRAETWKQIAELYEQKLIFEGDPFVGGISVSDKETRELDTDRPESYFKRGMFEIEDGSYE